MDHQVIDCVRNNMEYRGVGMMRSLSDSGIEEGMGIRKGAWTEEEDAILANYVTLHGEGHWNFLARSAGLSRTGKSCRLRWLNYLRPNVRRGNITLQEQLLILHLHSRWGNRWSKIAQELPGRTDNEIKNYWRTRVVKQAKQLKCDVNSKQFRDAMRFVWMPRLQERIQASSSQTSSSHSSLLLRSHSNSTQFDCHLISTCSNYAEQESSSWNDVEYSQEIQAVEFEAANADLWTHENISFLQQQLADDL